MSWHQKEKPRPCLAAFDQTIVKLILLLHTTRPHTYPSFFTVATFLSSSCPPSALTRLPIARTVVTMLFARNFPPNLQYLRIYQRPNVVDRYSGGAITPIIFLCLLSSIAADRLKHALSELNMLNFKFFGPLQTVYGCLEGFLSWSLVHKINPHNGFQDCMCL